MKYCLKIIATCLLLPGTKSFVPNVESISSRHVSKRSLIVPQQKHLLYAVSKESMNNLNNTPETNFQKLKSFDSRLASLEKAAPDMLGGFYEKHLKSFSVKPGSVQRLSITSTCYGLQAVFAPDDKSLYDDLACMEMSPYVEDSKDPRIPVRGVALELLMAEWRENDMFQVPLLLYTLLKVDSNRQLLGASASLNEVQLTKMRRLVESTLSARPRRRSGANQRFSEYIQFRCCQALAELFNSTPSPSEPAMDDIRSMTESSVAGLPDSAFPEGAASEIALGLQRCNEVSLNELCLQMAYRSAGDVTSFDVMKLAYSLLTYIASSSALSGTAGREMVPGDGPEPGTKIPPANKWLVSAALAAFFDEQNPDGLWDRGQPIYKSFRRTGRDIGNAYVFATTTLADLMELLPPEAFRPHLNSLQRTLDWIEAHQIVEIIPDYCDVESNQCYGKALTGWNSPHLPREDGPQAWSTAQTLTCISRMRTVTRKLMHTDVLAEFKGQKLSTLGARSAAWDRLLDTDLGDCGTSECRTLKSVLEERMIKPFDSASSLRSFGAAYSSILFGPPGTAKTTICEALAEKMGWDFVVIDTAAFLADGLTNVASRIRYVFERLQALEKTIILFDEIEEFCLDRETPGIGMESRMLTTAMLTAINDLRRAKRSIFFLATNRLRAFDAAITRPGRFDMQLFVGTPNLEAKCIQLRQKLAGVAITEEQKKKAEDTYRDFLDSKWLEDAMYLNYLEGMQFAAACAAILASGAELTHEEMGRMLKAQAAVMTAKGSIRDEILASMKLSRL